jgi:hypothetical protein
MPSILFSNEFLMSFIDHEILNIMAVIMTISIATIATIHIWFNELEDKHQKTVFGAARREINSSAFWFIGLFVAQLVLLIVRSFSIFASKPTAMSIFNGISLLLLLTSVITLWDIMAVVKSLTPRE